MDNNLLVIILFIAVFLIAVISAVQFIAYIMPSNNKPAPRQLKTVRTSHKAIDDETLEIMIVIKNNLKEEVKYICDTVASDDLGQHITVDSFVDPVPIRANAEIYKIVTLKIKDNGAKKIRTVFCKCEEYLG